VSRVIHAGPPTTLENKTNFNIFYHWFTKLQSTNVHLILIQHTHNWCVMDCTQ